MIGLVRVCDWIAVDRDVGVVYLRHVRDVIRRVRNVREGAVGQIEGSRVVSGQPVHVQRDRSRVDDEVGEIEGTAEVRQEVAGLAKVVHEDEDDCAVEVGTVEPVDMHVPGEPAAFGVRLHEEGVPGTAPDRRVVVGVDVLNAAGHLAAETDRAHGAFELVVPDDDVLSGYVDPATICVPARLDGDVVVAGQERAVLDHHVVAAFGIAAVAVHTRVVGCHAVDGYVPAQGRMQLPEEGVT